MGNLGQLTLLFTCMLLLLSNCKTNTSQTQNNTGDLNIIPVQGVSLVSSALQAEQGMGLTITPSTVSVTLPASSGNFGLRASTLSSANDMANLFNSVSGVPGITVSDLAPTGSLSKGPSTYFATIAPATTSPVSDAKVLSIASLNTAATYSAQAPSPLPSNWSFTPSYVSDYSGATVQQVLLYNQERSVFAAVDASNNCMTNPTPVIPLSLHPGFLGGLTKAYFADNSDTIFSLHEDGSLSWINEFYLNINFTKDADFTTEPTFEQLMGYPYSVPRTSFVTTGKIVDFSVNPILRGWSALINSSGTLSVQTGTLGQQSREAPAALGAITGTLNDAAFLDANHALVLQTSNGTSTLKILSGGASSSSLASFAAGGGSSSPSLNRLTTDITNTIAYFTVTDTEGKTIGLQFTKDTSTQTWSLSKMISFSGSAISTTRATPTLTLSSPFSLFVLVDKNNNEFLFAQASLGQSIYASNGSSQTVNGSSQTVSGKLQLMGLSNYDGQGNAILELFTLDSNSQLYVTKFSGVKFSAPNTPVKIWGNDGSLCTCRSGNSCNRIN